MKFQWACLSLFIGLTGLGIGITLVADYHHDDVQSNAFGIVTNVSKCMLDCQPVISKYKSCTSSGTINIMYEYFNITTQTYYDRIKVPGFCTQDCCWSDMKAATTIYFYIEDGMIKHISNTVDYNLHVFLITGIIMIILGAALSCNGIFLWYESCKELRSGETHYSRI